MASNENILRRIGKKILIFVRDLRENGSYFYHAMSTNILGGVVFGILSPYFNPRILMSEAAPYFLLRVSFGAGTGIAYSLGIAVFSMPYLERFSEAVDKRFKNGVIKDAIYSYLSLGMSILILVLFAYFLFFIYAGGIPIGPTPLFISDFTSSLSHTNWSEIFLIPTAGTLTKAALRLVKMLLKRRNRVQG